MAEKEERIRIEQFEYEGYGHCAGFSTDGEGYYCEFSGESIPITKEICEKKCPYDSSISRQEAIDRMAKEIARQYDPRKPNKEEYEKVWKQELFPATKKYYLEQAEVVLNALLEEK